MKIQKMFVVAMFVLLATTVYCKFLNVQILAADSSKYSLTGSFLSGHAYRPLTKNPDFQEYPNLKLYGSWTDEHNHIGSLESPSFSTTESSFSLLLAGHPNMNGNFVGIKNLENGRVLRLFVDVEPGTSWKRFDFFVPKSWSKARIALIATSRAEGSGNWIGLSEPFIGRTLFSIIRDLREFFVIIFILTLQFFSLVVVILSSIIIAKRFYSGSENYLLIGFAALSFIVYSIFWTFLLQKDKASIFSIIFLVSATVFFIYNFLFKHTQTRRLLTFLSKPLAIWYLYSLMAICFGFMYGFHDELSSSSRRYFFWTADNELPLVYANKILNLKQHPLWDNWNVYARPPLQTAYYLFLSPIVGGRGAYHSLGVLLQSSFILATWSFLKMCKFSKLVQIDVLFLAIFSFFALMNSVFVWPKLLAATFIIFAAGTVLRPNRSHNLLENILICANFGFGMLSHGGSFFPVTILGLYVSVGVYRNSKDFVKGTSNFLCMLLVGALLLGSWVYYASQRGFTSDLTNWHLGGTLTEGAFESRRSVEIIFAGYSKLSIGDIVLNKLANLKSQFFPSTIPPSFNTQPLVDQFIDLSLSSMAFSVIVPLLSVVAILLNNILFKRKISVDISPLINRSFILLISIVLFWCLAMFGPTMAIGKNSNVHALAILPQGSYFPQALLLIIFGVLLSTYCRGLFIIQMVFQFFSFCFLALRYRGINYGPDILANTPRVRIDFLCVSATVSLVLFIHWLNKSGTFANNQIHEN